MPRGRSLSDDIVLERAMQVFWRHGYAGTTLRELTQATGLGSAALYHRYADKQTLFVRVLGRYADRGLAPRIARLAAQPSPLQSLRSFFEELVAASLADPERRGCLLVNTALDGADMGEAARETVRARLGEVESFFASRLACAVAAGALPPDTDVAARAAALLGSVFAIRVAARLYGDAQRLRTLAAHALAFAEAVPPVTRAVHRGAPGPRAPRRRAARTPST
ncbi:TetR/AcrR family transcriptional regulator [Thiomonas sp. FB-6]|uniref:TetR/AcrR family transcriptional regulator n=1 Tax=Thiomonas sp. FB-6 TaxID=1158291 RepID=UPI00039DE70C|nr:TetR/AcrR family transcriptional regulator [Thiomonas sp. FB-6]